MPASLALAALLSLGAAAHAQTSDYNATPYSAPAPAPAAAPAPGPTPSALPPFGPEVGTLPLARKGAPPRAKPGPVVPATMQQPARGRGGDSSGEGTSYRIQLEPPGLERLALIASDRDFEERIRQESRGYEPMERVQFPEEPVLSTEYYRGRGASWPNLRLVVAPNYVCHERLYFRHLNTEQYGWDLGILQPIISAAAFWVDFGLLPYHWATAPCQRCECSAGNCLPGDPVPYMLYPPELSLTGALAEATTIVGLIAIFP